MPNSNEQLGEERVESITTRLRPRNEPTRATLLEAQRRAQPILEDIDEAQGRVRNKTRGQKVAAIVPTSGLKMDGHNVAPLRIRKRILEQSADAMSNINLPAGSQSTAVRHLDVTDIANLDRSSTTQQFPIQSGTRAAFNLLPFKDHSISSQMPHHPERQIWYPPLSSLEEEQGRTPSRGSRLPSRSQSPVYPPLPAAYPFTPRKRIVDPQDVPPVAEQSRSRVAGGRRPNELIDPSEFDYDEPPQAGSSMPPKSLATESRASENLSLEDFFQAALGPSLQPAPMDVDMENLLTGNDSSAKRKSMDEDTDTRKTAANPKKRTKRAARANVKDAKRSAEVSLRRSTRNRDDSSSTTTTERDIFGFTIRDDLESLDHSTLTDSTSGSTNAPKQKKPLARTKPTLKITPEEDSTTISDSSDEENVKKKRRVSGRNGKLMPGEVDTITVRKTAGGLVTKNSQGAPSSRTKGTAAAIIDERSSPPKALRSSRRRQAATKAK
ncbi:hypothetical protein M422DRAFT_40572 [Sphaerobolus stellatus SS14]|nr:hypothetical protein M422DRAFT_40572 [Sphaerobolus stellatus SS14]